MRRQGKRIYSMASLLTLALLVAGLAAASAAAGVVRVPVVAYRLHASLAPVGPASVKRNAERAAARARATPRTWPGHRLGVRMSSSPTRLQAAQKRLPVLR
jgi:hypothetical protein